MRGSRGTRSDAPRPAPWPAAGVPSCAFLLRIVSFEGLAAGGESLAALDGRCIPAGHVAPRSNTPGILTRRALPAGRLARLGATPDFHHGLLAPAKPRAHFAILSRPRQT